MKFRSALLVGAVGLAMSAPGLAQNLDFGADGYYSGGPDIKPTGKFPVQEDDYQEYMKKLMAGKITPFGAIRAGGDKGIIPKWDCTPKGVPSSLEADVDLSKVDTHTYPYFTESPYQEEEPRFVITADNYKKYAEHLSDGVEKLLTSYPDAARIPVYPTHRTACYQQYVYEHTRVNVKYGQAVHNGAGAIGIKQGMPFPLPDNGYEANWNNLIGMQGVWSVTGHHGSVAAFPGGRRAIQTEHRIVTRYYYMDPSISRTEYYKGSSYLTAYLNIDKLPPRTAGGGVTGWNRLHMARHPRLTWQYSPGTRRVRRYPYYGFDTPTGAGGLRGIDESSGWNGTPERFNIKVLGVKKLIVPYNAYRMDFVSRETLIGYPVVNPDVTRWELHRVRVIELTLKEGYSHWYQRRVLYQDMDTGHYLLADNYDHQGNLWRTSVFNYVWTPVVPGMVRRVAVYYDFIANAYTTAQLINKAPHGRTLTYNTKDMPIGWFGPAKLRQYGIR